MEVGKEAWGLGVYVGAFGVFVVFGLYVWVLGVFRLWVWVFGLCVDD